MEGGGGGGGGGQGAPMGRPPIAPTISGHLMAASPILQQMEPPTDADTVDKSTLETSETKKYVSCLSAVSLSGGSGVSLSGGSGVSLSGGSGVYTKSRIPAYGISEDSQSAENYKLAESDRQSRTIYRTSEGSVSALRLETAVREGLKLDSKYWATTSKETTVNNTIDNRLSNLELSEKLSPTKEFKRPSVNISLAENALKLLPENDEVSFTPDSAYEDDWPSDGIYSSRRVGSVSGDSTTYSRRTSSTVGDNDCLLEPGESASRRASSGIGSTDGRSVYSRAQSIDDEPGESVSRRPSSNTCEGDDSIDDTPMVPTRDKINRRLESVFGSKESLNRHSSGGADLLEGHDPLSRRDSLLEAVLAAKRGGWRNLVRSESAESVTSFTSSLNSSLASDTSGCPCDDCLLGLTQPPRPKKTSNWRKVKNVVQWTPFIQTYKRHKYPWVQLAGHQGNFKAGEKQGTILKKLCPAEQRALEGLMKDVLRPYVPEYMGLVESGDQEQYLQLQDLLSDFNAPCVMDIKMGVRTYLEDELAKAREKPKLRKDMYDKMIQIDPAAPSEAEQRAQAVTKPRYMVWRETISSTATLGFRIEGVKKSDGTSSKDFKTTRSQEQVLAALTSFVNGYSHAPGDYLKRLKEIRATLETSKFFMSHELIGSSLLFVHNDDQAVVWLIDFAKSIPLPATVDITHRAPWVEGSHEDGYLLGLDNVIKLMTQLQQLQQQQKQQQQQQSSTVSSSTDDKESDANKNAQNTKDIVPNNKSSSSDTSISETEKSNYNTNSVNSNDTDSTETSKNISRHYLSNLNQTKELSLGDHATSSKLSNPTQCTESSSPTDIRNLVTNSSEPNSIS